MGGLLYCVQLFVVSALVIYFGALIPWIDAVCFKCCHLWVFANHNQYKYQRYRHYCYHHYNTRTTSEMMTEYAILWHCWHVIYALLMEITCALHLTLALCVFHVQSFVVCGHVYVRVVSAQKPKSEFIVCQFIIKDVS